MTYLKLSSKDSLNLINALRNGTTPLRFTESIMSGRSQEVQEFMRCLNLIKQNTGQIKVIVGDYGVGKTFLLRNFRTIASQNDFLVSSFSLSDSLRINKTEDLYYALMHNLSIKNHRTSFEQLFNLWIDNIKNCPIPNQGRQEINMVCNTLSKFNQNYARVFTNFMRARIQNNDEMSQVTSAWLSGELNLPHNLKEKYEIVGQIGKQESLDNLKAFIKLITLLDYKGLVVFIDELDWILDARSDIRAAAYHNIKQLVDLTTSGEIGHLMIVFSGTPELVRNREKGLYSYPALAQRLNLTTMDWHQNTPLALMRPVFQVMPLSNTALMELTHKVLRLYKLSHPLPIELTPDGLFEETRMKFQQDHFVTREFVTELIQKLDMEISKT